MPSDLEAKSDERLIWLREEPGSRSPGHSRVEIARVAVELADREGFEAVSMRRVAQELGAGTMTLYHYVANKDELVTLMADAAMGEVLVAEEELASGWRPAIAAIAKSTLSSLRRHRWLLNRLGDGRPGPNKLRHFEQSLRAVEGTGASAAAKLEAIVLVDEYIFGFAIREAQERDERADRWDPEVREFLQREMDSGAFPQASALFGDDLDAAREFVADVLLADGRFERGLDRLLDGLEASLRT
ncbi:MAG: TetR/AcrR family transcriptional regulator [Solirubrobacterales bacterium]